MPWRCREEEEDNKNAAKRDSRRLAINNQTSRMTRSTPTNVMAAFSDKNENGMRETFWFDIANSHGRILLVLFWVGRRVDPSFCRLTLCSDSEWSVFIN